MIKWKETKKVKEKTLNMLEKMDTIVDPPTQQTHII